jgi:hypothetical protein
MQQRRLVAVMTLLVFTATLGAARAEPPPPPALPPPTPLFGYDNGFFLRTADERYSLYVNGFAQVRYTADVAHDTFSSTFDLALGRLALSGNIFDKRLLYFFQFEGSTFGNNNVISMLDWWMRFNVSPLFYVEAGRHILPYSRQFYTHPGNLLFCDLSAADYAFNLPRSVGAQIGGVLGHFAWDIFVTNSIRALGVGTQVNRGDSIAAGARVEIDILNSYGYMETVPSADSPTSLSIGAAFAYNPVADPSSFQNVTKGDNTINSTVDLGFRWRRISVQGAFYWRHKLNNEGGDNYGYYAQTGVYLVPNRLELAGRASGVYFAAPVPIPVQPDKTIGEYTGGLNVYLFGHGAKLQADYSYVRHETFSSGTYPEHRVRVQTQILF